MGFQRICVVGTSGSGKTTFARNLARILDIPHYELDALAWGPEWEQLPRETLHQRVDEVAARPDWVIDGNYGPGGLRRGRVDSASPASTRDRPARPSLGCPGGFDMTWVDMGSVPDPIATRRPTAAWARTAARVRLVRLG